MDKKEEGCLPLTLFELMMTDTYNLPSPLLNRITELLASNEKEDRIIEFKLFNSFVDYLVYVPVEV
jgi:hypothetical protein